MLSKGKVEMTVVKEKMFEWKIQIEQGSVDFVFLQSKFIFKLILRKGAVTHKKGSAESLNTGCKVLFEKKLRLF